MAFKEFQHPISQDTTEELAAMHDSSKSLCLSFWVIRASRVGESVLRSHGWWVRNPARKPIQLEGFSNNQTVVGNGISEPSTVVKSTHTLQKN